MTKEEQTEMLEFSVQCAVEILSANVVQGCSICCGAVEKGKHCCVGFLQGISGAYLKL